MGKTKKLKDTEEKQGIPTGNNQKGQKKERNTHVTKRLEFDKTKKGK